MWYNTSEHTKKERKTMLFEKLLRTEQEMVTKTVQGALRYVKDPAQWTTEVNAVDAGENNVSVFSAKAVRFSSVGALQRAAVMDLRLGHEAAIHAIHVLVEFGNRLLHAQSREEAVETMDRFLKNNL